MYKYQSADIVEHHEQLDDVTKRITLIISGTEEWDELMLTNPLIEPADAIPDPTYREVRAARYKNELSPEKRVEFALADCVDALFKAVLDNDTTEAQDLWNTINTIKSEVPKP